MIFFFSKYPGTRLVIHKHGLCKGFCYGVQPGVLSTVTSVNGHFLRPTPSHCIDPRVGEKSTLN